MTDPVTSETLAKCPFCGTRAKVNEASNAPGYWIVGCVSVRCDFQPNFQHVDRAYAVKRWNARPK